MDRFADMFMFYACLLDVKFSWRPGGLPGVAMGGTCGLDCRWCTICGLQNNRMARTALRGKRHPWI